MTSDLVFKALADRTRRNLLQLIYGQELSVSELVEVLGLPQSTVSRHLRVLREAELVAERREGATVLNALAQPGSNGNGPSLPDHLLSWIGHQELPKPLDRRLKRVLDRRASRGLKFFEDVGHRWDQLRIECFGERFHLEALLALLPSDWIVADVGTGTGYLLPTLASCFRRVIAVDPVETMLQAAREREELADCENVDFRVGDLSSLPIPAEAVDLAIASLVLHHVPSPAKAIAELRRVVQPGGQVLILEQQAHELRDFYEQMQDRWWGFQPDDLRKELAEAGFDRIAWRPLRTAEPPGQAPVGTPDLFAMTARRLESR